MLIPELVLKTKKTLASLNVKELKAACKELGIPRYSKLKKDELVKEVWDALQPHRLALAATKTNVIESKDKDKTKPQYDYLSLQHIKNTYELVFVNPLATASSSTPDEIIEAARPMAKILLLEALNFYSLSSILNAYSASKLKVELDKFEPRPGDPIFNSWFRESFYKNCWLELLSDARKEQKYRQDKKVSSYQQADYEGIKVNTEKIIGYAMANLESDDQLAIALSLAILSGRRMIEIFGISEYEQVDSFLHVTDLSKNTARFSKPLDTIERSDLHSGYFVPLCEPKDWLSGLSRLKRGLELIGKESKPCEQVSKEEYDEIIYQNKRNTTNYRRHYKATFSDLGIDSFKQVRNVYAGICLATLKTIPDIEAMDILTLNMIHGSGDSTNHYRKYSAQPLMHKVEDFIEFQKFCHNRLK